MILPPVPKWKKTTDDIDSADFLSRSADYERSLLPPDLVFPRAGQVWETVRDCQVHVLTRIGPKGPLLSPAAQLRRGERVRILTLDGPKPLQVRFQPLHYQESHESIAPHNFSHELCLRTAPTVPGLEKETAYFNELFRLVEDVA